MLEEKMKFLDRPLAFTDLEMTGLKMFKYENGIFQPWHEICEIGLVLADQETLEILDTLNLRVKIDHLERLDPEAQKVNGYNEKDWIGAIGLKEAITLYNEKVKEAVFTAHNVTWDWGFMDIAYTLTGIKPLLDYHRIDLLTYAKGVLEAKGYKPEKYRLSRLAEFLGLHPEPLPHRAINGARAAYDVYKSIRDLPLIKK